MAKKRNRITRTMNKTIDESSHLNGIVEVSIKDLENNPYQPRLDINITILNELISSIEENGLLQPIVITEKNKEGKYIIIAGHRRYEAFKIMGKNSIKASMLKDIEDKDLAVMSLAENLIRENLHPIENAIAMKYILDKNIVESQNKLAEYVGLSKGYVSKLMNILKLPDSIIRMIKEDNYTDVNILIILNKLEDEEVIHKAYQEIKSLSRNEAEKYIKIHYLKEKDLSLEESSGIFVKQTKSKIEFNLNIKTLSEKETKIIVKKITKLQNEITLILQKEKG